MAEEEVAAAEASPAPLDHKRKLEDLEPEAPNRAEPTSDEPEKSNGDSDAAAAEAAESDKGDGKRPRVEEKPDGSGTALYLYQFNLGCCVRVFFFLINLLLR